MELPVKDRILNAAQDGFLDYLISLEDGEPATFMRALRDDLAWSDDDADQVELTLRTMIANRERGHRHDWH